MAIQISLATHSGGMSMNQNKDLRKLPLSHLVYLDSQVDADKANEFVVYHYPLLNNNYQWREKKAWEERIDIELDSRQFIILPRNWTKKSW